MQHIWNATLVILSLMQRDVMMKLLVLPIATTANCLLLIILIMVVIEQMISQDKIQAILSMLNLVVTRIFFFRTEFVYLFLNIMYYYILPT